MKKLLSIIICAAVLMTAGITPAKADIWSDISNGFNGVVNAAGEVASSAAGWVGQQVDNASAFIGSASQWIEGTIEDSVKWAGDTAAKAGEWTTARFEAALKWITDNTAAAKSSLGEAFKSVAAALSEMTGTAGEKLSAAAAVISEKLDVTVEELVTIWNNVYTYAKKLGVTPEKVIAAILEEALDIDSKEAADVTTAGCLIIGWLYDWYESVKVSAPETAPVEPADFTIDAEALEAILTLTEEAGV